MRSAAALVWVLALLLAPAVRAAVLAIDYGAEFTKLSLVKPGVPFDVVLDRDSKRKISSVVGWKRDDRVFGAEGKMAATRFPQTHYPYIKPLLGAQAVPGHLVPIYPSEPSIHNSSITFSHPGPPPHFASPAHPSDDEQWTATALLAHQLAYYRGLAEGLAGESVKDVIVTVPAWWTQNQRRAYRDALELQGMTCLAMIGEGTAVGLNFAMTRTFPNYNATTGEGEREYHIIYDSGALSTTATILAFYQTSVYPTPKSKTAINTTHIEVLGTGWEEVGGVNFDLAIQSMLLSQFEAKSGKVVGGDKRALAKLAREANRVKQILSANQESNVAIESLLDDVDYRDRISRTDLEAALSSDIPRFASPLTSALSAAGLSLDQITSVILFGGNTRVPLVQTAIRSVLGDKEELIAQNVNTDEGAVLGAAFWGAALSRQFKMKSIQLHEVSVFDFEMGVDRDVVFPKGTSLGDRKAIALPAVDQSVEISQNGNPLFAIQFTDVAASLSNFTSPDPFINLTFRLDHRGHIAAANAVIVSNSTIPEPAAEEGSGGGVAGALKGLFGKKDKKDKEASEGSSSDSPEEDEATKDAVNDILEKIKGKDREKEKEKEAKREKIAVRFREKPLSLRPMGGEEKRSTLARLTAIAAFEAAKTAREEARNLLEGYLYRLTGLLDPEGDNQALLEYSTPEEQTSLREMKDEAFEWLLENAEGADEKSLREKRASIEELEAPIIVRFQESRTRPKAVDDFQQAMFAARAFLVEATANNTAAKEAQAAATPEKPVAPPKYTDEELKTVEELMKENELWIDGIMSEQIKLEVDKTKNPVVMTKELDDKGKHLQMTVLRLVNKKAPRVPRAKTSSTSSTSASTATASSADNDAENPSTSSSSATASASEEPSSRVHEEL